MRRSCALPLRPIWSRARGLRVSPEQIFIGAGTEYLYGLIVQLLGRRLRYAVEDPGYRKISGIYAANDVTVCPIGLDSEGLSVEALRASGAQIAPYFPGAPLSHGHRHAHPPPQCAAGVGRRGPGALYHRG